MMRRLLSIAFCFLAVGAFAQSPSATGSNIMSTGQILRSATGDYLVSSNKVFVMVMQRDGNLCEYWGSSATNFKPGAIWCSNAVGSGNRFSVQMHYTNNFCVTTGDEWGQGPALWCTNQVGPGSGPAFAMLNDDGNFVIKTGTPAAPGAQLWQNGISLATAAVTVQHPSFGYVVWPDGSRCGGNELACQKVFAQGTNVTLTAQRIPPHGFQAWTGPTCTGTAETCTVQVKAGLSPVIASFVQRSTITVNPPPVNGKITGAGLDCPPTCTSEADWGKSFKMTAAPAAGYTFVGWTGDLAGRPSPYDMGLGQDMRLSAVFGTPVTVQQPADGVIEWADGQTCPPVCIRNYPLGGTISLKALTPTSGGYTFREWSRGLCTDPAGNPCTFTLGSLNNPAVTANYSPPVVVTLSLPSPSGGASIRWPDGQTCPPTCSRAYGIGTNLSLSAISPTPLNFTFKTWSGNVCTNPSASPCTFVVAAGSAPNIGVTYNAAPVTVTLLPPDREGVAIQWGDGSTCPPVCQKTFAYNDTVSLTALYTGTVRLRSWTGACAGQGPTCRFDAANALQPIGSQFSQPMRIYRPFAGLLEMAYTPQRRGWEKAVAVNLQTDPITSYWFVENGELRPVSTPSSCVSLYAGDPIPKLAPCIGSADQRGWFLQGASNYAGGVEMQVMRNRTQPSGCLHFEVVLRSRPARARSPCR